MLVLSALVLLASSASGQIIRGQPTSGSSGPMYTYWKLTPDTGEAFTISQFMVPLSGLLPIRDNTEMRFYVASAVNSLEDTDGKADVTGLTDFRVQFNRSLLDDRFLLSLGFNLPTGKRKLDLTNERRVIDVLSESFLDFPMRRYGEGFGFNLLAGAARNLGPVNAGAGIMYEYTGAYEPYEGVDSYDPGDLINASVGAEMKHGRMSWTGDVIFTAYVADKLDGAKVFRQGRQLDFQLGGQYSMERHRARGSLRYGIRGRNSRYDASSEKVTERLKLYGNEFQISGDFAYFLPRAWYLTPSGSLKLIESNEEGFGNSHTLTLGAALGRSLGERFNLELGGKYLTGRADGGKIDLTGFQIVTSLVGTL